MSNVESYRTCAEWQRFIASGRNKHDRPCANNTKAMLCANDGVGIKLHNTVILLFFRDDSVVLDSGGWQTVTTKERMNRYLPSGYSIYQEQSIWYLSHSDGRVAFADGMRIGRDGKITGEGEDPKVKIKLKKQIRAYAKRYMEEFMLGSVPKPSNGDCLLCRFEYPESKKHAKQEGSHILEHMKEDYYVPQLLMNAIKHKRAMMSPAAKEYIAAMWAEKPTQNSGTIDWARDIVSTQILKTLERWLRFPFGISS